MKQPGHAGRSRQPQTLRRRLQAQRLSLPPLTQQLAAVRAATLAGPLLRGRCIASYHACNGELATLPLHKHCLRYGRNVYLPVIINKHQLHFVPYTPFSRGQRNRYGIPQPRYTRVRSVPLYKLGTIVVPLVGFDQRGHRLGSGGGYYDRLLAGIKKPTVVIGLAHRCQQLRQLPPQPWDQPLPCVVTPGRVVYARNSL